MTSTLENETDQTRTNEINLGSGVTRAEAERILTAIAAHVRNGSYYSFNSNYLANCSEWYGTRAGVTVPRLDGGVTDESWLKPEKVAEFRAMVNRQYGAELRNIRGRILTHVNNGYLTLAQANEIFAAGQLPQYAPVPDGQHPYAVSISGIRFNVSSADSNAMLAERAQAAMREVVTACGGNPARTHPNGFALDVGAGHSNPVAEEDLVPVLYRN